MIEFIECPEENCDALAEVMDRFRIVGSGGSVDHQKTRCLAGHVLTALEEA